MEVVFSRGYNSTILAYGQTGAGKTFTMLGIISISLMLKLFKISLLLFMFIEGREKGREGLAIRAISELLKYQGH